MQAIKYSIVQYCKRRWEVTNSLEVVYHSFWFLRKTKFKERRIRR